MDRSQKRKMKNMVKDLNYVNYENLYIPAKLMAIISPYKSICSNHNQFVLTRSVQIDKIIYV